MLRMAILGRRSTFSYFALPAVIIGGVLGLFIPDSQAATVKKKTAVKATILRATELRVGASQRFSIFGKFKGGATVAAGDVNGDGSDEYVVGAGPTGGPQILIINQSGATVGSFFAYDKNNRDGVNVAVGDLDGDGIDEIVTAPQAGSPPEVRVYTINGLLQHKFMAFEAGFLGGVNVAVIAAPGGATGNIVAGSGFGREAEVRVYNNSGSRVAADWLPLGKAASNGVSVAAGWSDTFGQNIVVVGAGQGEKPLVQIFSASTKQKLAQWLAYDGQVKTGLAVGYENETIATSPRAGGGPDVRTFTARGELLNSTLVFEKNFRGGVNVSLTSLNGSVVSLAVPTTAPLTAAGVGKKIVISLSKQQLTLYEKGQIMSVRKISSGKWSMPTPTGEFQVKNKIPVAYSKAYGLYMENWMAFSPDGRYGMHSLPFWKLKNGGKLYEGAAHIGTPVSHGCVRQTLADSKTLFDWAPVGTPVSIKA